MSGHAGRMEPRPVSRDGAALLTAILDGEPGAGRDLRSHLDTLEAQSGCNCGCGSLDFVYPDDKANDPASGPATVYPVEAEVLGDDGDVIGESCCSCATVGWTTSMSTPTANRCPCRRGAA